MGFDPRLTEPGAMEAWLRKRRGLGASEVAAIMHLDTFMTVEDVYDRLVALHDHDEVIVEEPGPDQKRGWLLEETAAGLYVLETGKSVRHVDPMQHPSREYLTASADRYRIGGADEPSRLVEIKVVRASVMSKIVREQMPRQSHLVQVQVQLDCYAMEQADLFYWCPETMETLIVTIDRNADALDGILQWTDAFWAAFEKRERPASVTPLSAYCPPLMTAVEELEDVSLEAQAAVYRLLSGKIKEATAARKRLKEIIIDSAGEQNSKVKVGGFHLSMPHVVSKKLDEGAIDAELRSCGSKKRLKDFKKPSGGFRRLTISGVASEEIASLDEAELRALAGPLEERNDGEDF